jgi:hypothetical protein
MLRVRLVSLIALTSLSPFLILAAVIHKLVRVANESGGTYSAGILYNISRILAESGILYTLTTILNLISMVLSLSHELPLLESISGTVVRLLVYPSRSRTQAVVVIHCLLPELLHGWDRIQPHRDTRRPYASRRGGEAGDQEEKENGNSAKITAHRSISGKHRSVGTLSLLKRVDCRPECQSPPQCCTINLPPLMRDV